MQKIEHLNFYELSGLLYQPIFLGAVFISILLHPDFNLKTAALSDLGATTNPHGWVFNLGIIVSTVFGLIFAVGILIRLPRPFNFYGYIIMISMLMFIVVALFPDDLPVYIHGFTVHKIFSVSGFLVASAALLLFGMTWALNRKWRLTGVLFVVGSAMVLFSTLMALPGLAVFELAFSGVLIVWSILTIAFNREVNGAENI
jgi:hypothetical membrane protein